jgi:hypothetical protein
MWVVKIVWSTGYECYYAGTRRDWWWGTTPSLRKANHFYSNKYAKKVASTIWNDSSGLHEVITEYVSV